MGTVVTLTMNPALDLAGSAERLPEGHKTHCGNETRAPGGGGINVARGITLMGGEALAIYPAGGPSGDQLETLLAAEGVPQQRIPIQGPTRENVAIREKVTGTLYHLVFSGPRLSEREWRTCLDTVDRAEPVPDYLVLSGSLPPGVPEDFYAYAARTATERGSRVILETTGPALRHALEAGVFLVKPERAEFGQFGVPDGADYETYLDAMTEMVRDGLAQVVIVTVGADGALLATRTGERRHVRPPPTEGGRPVDAGDSFIAAMTHRLACGTPVEKAFRYGVAAAAAVKTPDTLCSLSAIEAAYRHMR